MAERLSDRLIEYLKLAEGKFVHLKDIRVALNIQPGSRDDANLRTQMSETMVKNKIVSPSGKNDGIYKVVKQVQPVPVFSIPRERKPVFDLNFPRDFNTDMELEFAEHIVFREGDLITLGGVKSKGKTLLCLNLCAMNIDKKPVLMGNEYTVSVNGKYEPAPRFFNRLDTMSQWIEWTDENGYDKFLLLPVRDDYAEHIVADRINIIDWINLDGGQLYDIGKVLEGIKANIGRGIAIVALQKGESAPNPRGGQFVRDFSDLEILLDGFGDDENDILLTLKGVKEKHKPIVGKTYAYHIDSSGTKILNFREVKKCFACHGQGYTKSGKCGECFGCKFVDV